MNETTIYKILMITVTAFCLLFSCSNGIEDVTQDDIQQSQQQTVRMSLNVSRTEFDTFSKGDTRAANTEWKEGDVLYLRFHTADEVVVGNATYNATEQDWTVNYYGTLTRDVKSKVEVSFFEGVSLADGNEVKLSPLNGIYQDSIGEYVYSSDKTLRIKANLRPMTSRIRFKGEKGIYFIVDGMQYYSTYDISSGSFIAEKDFLYYKVENDGYTKYIYTTLSSAENPQLKINRQNDDGWDYLYTLACTPDILAIGKSGWMNIPTATNRNGWKMKQVSGEENGHMWVDLGLPSGTKWADENIGADIAQWQYDGDISNILGDVFSFGETSSSEGYNGYGDIQGYTYYDTALDKWGGKWCMPSEQDFQELIDYCNFRWITGLYDLEDKGYIVMGQTGEEIFLPVEKYNENYWSSTTAEDGIDWLRTDYETGEIIWEVCQRAYVLSLYENSYSVYLENRKWVESPSLKCECRIRAIIK